MFDTKKLSLSLLLRMVTPKINKIAKVHSRRWSRLSLEKEDYANVALQKISSKLELIKSMSFEKEENCVLFCLKIGLLEMRNESRTFSRKKLDNQFNLMIDPENRMAQEETIDLEMLDGNIDNEEKEFLLTYMKNNLSKIKTIKELKITRHEFDNIRKKIAKKNKDFIK